MGMTPGLAWHSLTRLHPHHPRHVVSCDVHYRGIEGKGGSNESLDTCSRAHYNCDGFRSTNADRTRVACPVGLYRGRNCFTAVATAVVPDRRQRSGTHSASPGISQTPCAYWRTRSVAKQERKQKRCLNVSLGPSLLLLFPGPFLNS